MGLKQIVVVLSFLSTFLAFDYSFAQFKFSSRESAIRIASGANLEVYKDLQNFDGTIRKVKGGNIGSVNDASITFNDGILEVGDSEAFLTANFDPTGNDIIKLQGTVGTANRFRAEPGRVTPQVKVYGVNNRLDGQPLFNDPIWFLDHNVSLTIALQSKLDQNIELRGGTLRLEDDLYLADDVLITPSGTINFNKRTLHMPGKDNSWTTTFLMQDAADIQLHSKTSLSGTWTFKAVNGDYNAYLNGNGNILDLTNSGTLWVEPNVDLYLVDVTIKGLGVGYGTIMLAGNGANQSKLYLHNSKIALAANYTVTTGGWYIEGGDSTIITDAYTLSFTDGADSFGTLTVDNVTLWYDSLDAFEADSSYNLDMLIWPSHPFHVTNNPGSNLTYLNSGLIKNTEILGKEGDTCFSYPTNYLNKNHDLKPYHKLLFHKLDEDAEEAGVKSMELDGRGYFVQLPRDSADNFIVLQENVAVTLKNIVLKNFCPDSVSIASSSTLHFGNGVVIELAENRELGDANYTMTFIGSAGEGAQISGFGNAYRLTKDYSISVDPNMTLTLKGVCVTGLSSNKLRCIGEQSQLDLINSQLILEDTYSFTEGKLNIYEDVIVSGSGQKFAFRSPQEYGLYIHDNSKFLIDHAVTFSYDSGKVSDPGSAKRDGLVMESLTSKLSLLGATLHSTATGIKLTKGVLEVDGKSYLSSDALVKEDGIRIGDYTNNGDANYDLTLNMLPAAKLKLKSGYIIFDNSN